MIWWLPKCLGWLAWLPKILLYALPPHAPPMHVPVAAVTLYCTLMDPLVASSTLHQHCLTLTACRF